MMPEEETSASSIFPEEGATSVLYSADDEKKKNLIMAGVVGLGAFALFMFIQKRNAMQQ